MVDGAEIRLSRFGMPTLLELDSLPEQVDLCRRLGLGVIEINCNIPQYSPYELDPLLVKKLSGEHGIQFVLHLPEELDVSSFHAPLRDGHLRYCRQALEWAAKAGVSLLNLHLNKGTYFTVPDGRVWLYEKYMDRYLKTTAESYRRMDAIAREHGLMVCVENTGDFHLPFIRNALIAILEYGSVFLTWDTGHDASSQYRDRKVIMEYEDKIRHMHLHDADGEKKHLPLFTGQVDISGSIAFAVQHDLKIVIETKTAAALDESVAMIKKTARGKG